MAVTGWRPSSDTNASFDNYVITRNQKSIAIYSSFAQYIRVKTAIHDRLVEGRIENERFLSRDFAGGRITRGLSCFRSGDGSVCTGRHDEHLGGYRRNSPKARR